MTSRPLLNRLVGVPEHDNDGWAGASVRHAVRTTLLASLALWHLVTGLAALVSARQIDHVEITVVIHLLLAALSVRAAQGRFPFEILAVGNWLAYLWNWSVIPDVNVPLFFGTVWLATLTAALCGFFLHGLRGLLLPAVALAAVPPAMVWLEPDRDWTMLPLSFFVTGLTTAVVTRIGISFLQDFARDADRISEQAERESRLLAQARAASRTSAEGARVLHDTVINTLSAIASGGAAVRDLTEVQTRCRRDVETITGLLHGAEQTDLPWSEEIGTGTLEQPVLHTGLNGPEVDAHLALLPPATAQALRRATAEAVRNALKHSGAPRVEVDVRAEDDLLTVSVRDDGRGFDGRPVPGRGLAESVLARASAADIDVRIDTAPGAGTTIALTHGPRSATPATVDFMSVVVGIRRQAALLWAAGLTLAGLIVTFSNHHGQPNHAYTMVALDALAFVVVWRFCRNRRHMPHWCAGLLLVLIVATYLSAAAGVGFGRDEPVLWQALGVTGPLILLLGFGRYRLFFTGLAVVSCLTLGLAVEMLAESAQVATTVVMAGLFGIGFPFGWYVFHVALTRIGRRAVQDQRRAHRASDTATTTRASQEARRRWHDAGLHASLELLSAIADGVRLPSDETVRQLSAYEESHLRELTKLDPELVRIGHWLARALARARERGVRLAIRTDGSDLPEDAADNAGGLLVRAVDLMPEGATLVATFFAAPTGTRISLVAPTPHLAGLERSTPGVSGGHPLQRQVLGEQEMIELVLEHIEEEALAS